jgi:phasin family protein
VKEAVKAPAPAAKNAAKPAKAKPAALKAAVVSRKAKPNAIVKAKALTPKAKAPAKPKVAAKAAPKPITKKSVFQQIRDKMTMDAPEFTTKIKGAVTEAQVKAKEAFDKGAATFGEYNEFTKGNLEAVAASGKILAAGVQSLGKTFVEDGKSAFETLTAEVKELAAVKSPADFFKLQAEFLRRNVYIAVANTSKNSDAVVKLAKDVAKPISARIDLAVEKI